MNALLPDKAYRARQFREHKKGEKSRQALLDVYELTKVTVRQNISLFFFFFFNLLGLMALPSPRTSSSTREELHSPQTSARVGDFLARAFCAKKKGVTTKVQKKPV